VDGVEHGGLRDVSQVKILVCYLLQSVGGTLPRHLLDQALQSDGLCSFWNISAALSALKDAGMVEELAEETQVSYTITPRGKECAAELETAVPLAVRERAVLRAASLLKKAKALKENRITIDKNEDGYTVSCTIPDRNRELMTVRLGVSDSLQANLIKEQFLEDPAGIYRKVLEAFGIY
jgi:hypothetical protein